jgi:glycosyltransferase involved in cell wall biosynthesis
VKPQAALVRRIRKALLKRAQAPVRPEQHEGAERRVFFVLMTAWGMGGTIRTVLNLAGYLAGRGYDVTILSVGRGRDEPFFELPPGVKVELLDDKRPGRSGGPIRRVVRTRSSVFMHPDDFGFGGFNLWVDWRLIESLRGRSGILITTRPGLNLMAAQLKLPGFALVGQEHMNLYEHAETIQAAVQRRYGALDVLSVLTPRDRKAYRQHLPRRVPVVRIPNTVRDMGPVRADLSAKTVLAAGRLTRQKGYDRLIHTWASVAEDHPDWHLRICGDGPGREKLERLISEREVEAHVTLAGAAQDLGAEMARASIFVLSSRWEGLPLVLLEAMSVGMAVVSFDCPTGPRAVIRDHENGLLIRPRKTANLAAGLNEMIEDEELRRRCSEGGIATAREYSIEAIGPRWEALLERAWKRSEARRSRPAA